MVVIAHVSDIHVDAGERSVERTGRVMRYLAALPTPVDVVVVTGDIADHGEESEYERGTRADRAAVAGTGVPGEPRCARAIPEGAVG